MFNFNNKSHCFLENIVEEINIVFQIESRERLEVFVQDYMLIYDGQSCLDCAPRLRRYYLYNAVKNSIENQKLFIYREMKSDFISVDCIQSVPLHGLSNRQKKRNYLKFMMKKQEN